MRTQLLLVAGAAGALLGCPNPNTYGTPRTVEPGKVTHTVAAEAWGATGETPGGASVGGTTPAPPTYQARIGVADSVDIGLRLANFSSLGADVKLNPLRGNFDLAVAPGVQWFKITVGTASASVYYLHLPLLLGINLNEMFSIVATPGLLYSVVSGSTGTASGKDAAATTKGVFARFGLGLDIRLANNRFALHPEITAMRNLQGDEGKVTIYMMGLGFNFGSLPKFDDVK